MAKRRRATDRYRWRDQDDYYGWRPYVDQAERRSIAKRHLRQLEKSGCKISPVLVEGRKIARTFWGSAWCDNLERYSDFANRLPRGRTYVRNGSVIDLQAGAGNVSALVCGSEIYTVNVDVASVPAARWRTICAKCAGGIDSLVELLQGRFSTAVMEHICREGEGLFPAPKEIKFSCSCPDWAYMCKHVAAVLYGIGARLDQQPELIFRLRQVDERDLLARAGEGLPLSRKKPAAGKVLADASLSEVFGVELAAPKPLEPPAGIAAAGPSKRAAERTRAIESGPGQRESLTAGRRLPAPAGGKRVLPTRESAAALPPSRKKAAGSNRGPGAGKEEPVEKASAPNVRTGERVTDIAQPGKARAKAGGDGNRAPRGKTASAGGTAAGVTPVQGASRRRPRPLPPAVRAEISERMKRYWAERRREARKQSRE